jgi:D-alanine-D-alanine ligase
MARNRNRKAAAPDYGKVAVLMGGNSAEREVSLETGKAVHAALRRRGIDAHLIDTRDQSLSRLLDQHFDRAFIALHGRGGEDGVVQGALQALGIPHTGSGVLGSALSMDKVRSKRIWRDSGLPTPDFIEIRQESDLKKLQTAIGFPLMIKPVHEGSSCGATKVKKQSELKAAWQKAHALDNRVLAERWITGREYTAAVLGREVLPMIRLETPREFFDYEAKYVEDTTRYICPCELPPQRERELAAMILSAFDAVDASGWGRLDFIIDSSNQPWLIEINTIPGMTSHSLVPMSAKQAGMDFDTLAEAILKTSLAVPGSESVPA